MMPMSWYSIDTPGTIPDLVNAIVPESDQLLAFGGDHSIYRFNGDPTAGGVIETLEQIVDRAHARGIKVMGGTLMPMGGLWLHNAETEAMRQAVNEWIRTSGKLDAVADFDAATRDPRAPERLRPALDSGDHIHPNDAGNAAMADAVDTTIFAR